MTCEHAHLDGAYVLGALSASERLAFEQHLVGCPECSRSVRELAGLPGLLAHVSATDLEDEDAPPLPPTLLPSLLREVRATQRRRSTLVAAVAAGVAAVAVGGLAVGGAFDGVAGSVGAASSTSTTSPRVGASASPVPMRAVGASPVTADLVLAPVAWGTRLDLSCTYETDEDYAARPDATYALVVRTRDGHEEQVATWRGLPGRTMHLSAATATRRPDIASVEMRTTDGLVVLRLPA
jgi:hypothetical protein